VDVVADNVQFLGRSEGGGEAGAPSGGGQRARAGQRGSRDDVELNEEDFDDIPF
jgi:single-stranded DNA-binding protein